MSDQRPFCLSTGNHTTQGLLPSRSLSSCGANILNLLCSFSCNSVVSTEAILPSPCIFSQRYLQSMGFVTLWVEKSWMLENPLQRSSTDTSSPHLAAPWRVQELFVQESRSPSWLPQSSPEVLDIILSSAIIPENTFTFVTLPWFWDHFASATKNFWSTKLPSSLVRQQSGTKRWRLGESFLKKLHFRRKS